MKVPPSAIARISDTERNEACEAVYKLIRALGDNPDRAGMQETPARFIKAMEFYTSGYNVNPADLLKTFVDGAERYDQLIVVKDIPFWSLCEHHLAPFFGVAHVAYLPNQSIVGLSKLARVVDAYSRRFQVQERLTRQIADLLQEELRPKGVGVMLVARHSCMECRGVLKAGCKTVTSALHGCIKSEDSAREEFLALCRS